MKLHDLRPAVGAHTRRTRVGRGIAAGGGKTAGRGTKGQKARAGGSIPAWFEGGQTPLHQRIPKLRGFKNPFKTQFEIVNLGRIAALVELGALEPGELPGAAKNAKEGAKPAKPAPITINQELLRAVGAVRTLDKPLKVLGHGEIDRPLFVVADAFSRTAVAKIEAAGGSVQVIELPTGPLAALGVEPKAARAAKSAPAVESDADVEEAPAKAPKAVRRATPAPSPEGPALEADPELADTATDAEQAPSKSPKAAKSGKASTSEATSAQAGLPSEGAGVTRRTEPAEPAKKTKASAKASEDAAEPETTPEASAPSADAPAGEDA
jgi:large subunit ribosomal protein L15